MTDIVSSVISNGDDIYAIEQEKKFLCSRGGCNKEYYEKENHDTACKFHPGPVMFHEGYKGWKCCNVKSTDFEEFMAFEGCAIGRHIAQEKKEPAPKPASSTPSNVKVVSNSDGIETYKNTDHRPVQPVPPKEPKKPYVYTPPKEDPDPPGIFIPIGTPCTHTGCNATYKDDSSRTELCVYHPGTPVFHEGSKGYDCCKRKLCFLKIFCN